MKRFLLSLLSFVWLWNHAAAAVPGEKEWKAVEELIDKELPKSAMESLSSLEKAALAEKAWPEAARALAWRITLESELHSDQPELKLTLMETALTTAPAEMLPVLRTLLATWYDDYFHEEGWRILQRTPGAAGGDIQTWDLKRTLAEIDARFQKALSDSATLRAIPIAKWDGFLQRNDLPDLYQPTLYDFLASEALAFYMMAEQEGAEGAHGFTFTDDSPALGTMEEFLAWKPGEGNSPKLRAILLLQELLAFHREDADPGARLLLELQRLEWAAAFATGEKAGERALAQVTALYQKHASHEASLRLRDLAATWLVSGKKPVEARRILQEGLASFGDSLFAPPCRAMILKIEDRELEIGTELIWNEAKPVISITSRNLKKAWFRLYSLPEPEGSQEGSTGSSPGKEAMINLLQAKPGQAWEVDLPPTDDFLSHRLSTPAPGGLPPGLYLLCASGSGGFETGDGTFRTTLVRVTPLALVKRVSSGPDFSSVDAWVLDAVSGGPVRGAEVTLWQRHTDKAKPGEKMRTVTTDKNGLATFVIKEWSDVLLVARHGASLVSSPGFYTSRDSSGSQESTYFFTDRSIYRPGQTIHFKGICVYQDRRSNNYRLLPGEKRTVTLKDMNGLGNRTVEVTTNAFGSFSGSFTLPLGGMTGMLQISDGEGSATIRVEEYKRPRFKVEIDPPAVPPRLGGAVVMKVRATGYSGAPADGATVKWSVTRESQYLSLVRGILGRSAVSGDQEEIARGVSKTGVDGTVEITFTAVPDVPEEEPSDSWFLFGLHAKVTDLSGETQEQDLTVSLGYADMKAALSRDNWQTTSAPVEFTVHTTSLEDAPRPATGTLTVYRLIQPDKVHRKTNWQLESYYSDDLFKSPEKSRDPDLSTLESWPSGEVVQRDAIKTGGDGSGKVAVKLGTGAYQAVLETADAFGKKVTAEDRFIVVDPDAGTFPVRTPFNLMLSADSVEPGGEFQMLWGTGYGTGRAIIEVDYRDKVVHRFWAEPGRTQQGLSFKVPEEYRGGFTIHVIQMRENRLSTESRFIDVPWSNKDLKLTWEHLTSKLEPGQKETWTLNVEGPGKEKAVAEMVAVLYDASLDALDAHGWFQSFDCFYKGRISYGEGMTTTNGEVAAVTRYPLEFSTYVERANAWGRYWPRWAGALHNSRTRWTSGLVSLRELATSYNPPAIPQNFGGGGYSAFANHSSFPVTPTTPLTTGAQAGAKESPGDSGNAPRPADLSKVSARRNMAETAFFLPHLLTDKDGKVKMTFTMPDAVTTWRFMGFAHDRELRSGYLEGETVTARDLMVQPNPPRFLREGDTVEFPVKITNQGAAPIKGMARLNLTDAVSLAALDAASGNGTPEQPYEIPAKESRTLTWRITVPDGQGFLTWKAVAGNDKLTDGEEGWLPVLPRRVLVTESLPLPLRDAGEKSFTLKKLTESAASDSLRHQSLTVRMVSQPAWYAVMALPYLMEYPHECSEQTFNRFYANALARRIAGSDQRIREVFDLWREAQPEAMKSPLERSPELKAIALEETPWLREAQEESRRNLGILFDETRLDAETARIMQKLQESQLPDGAWPWFPGGPGNDFITLYLVSGFGRLRYLGVEVDTTLAVKALDYLDASMAREYAAIVKEKTMKEDHFSSWMALYLYARSFYLEQRPVPGEQKEALDYFLAQAREHWTGLPRMSQAHAALGLTRFADQETPGKILKSLKERALNDEEQGMHWADTGRGWNWNQADVETQAMMVEAFREIGKDDKVVDDCQTWLLKQKQTHAWPTTKATADAVYAIVLGGTTRLSSGATVSVSLGGKEVKPEKVEAGTGFYEHRFSSAEIKPDMGTVKVVKTDKGVSWGSVHWQYMEDMAKITPHEGTPLKVTKALFTKVNTPSGPELRPVTGKVKVGDELVIRLELRTDRDMEFVHLKDQRPASVEPVNVLSGYKWQGGLGYYESTKDTASHFFFESLPKGTYVFEYSTRVQLRGKCQAGIAELQCMYAPVYNSHSAAAVLEVE